ncbi:MAG: hypothetical protein MMC33_000335 [Icmadophila ericetorum]|nr:hypothetical protein [Icmadophila ericetorum]
MYRTGKTGKGTNTQFWEIAPGGGAAYGSGHGGTRISTRCAMRATRRYLGQLCSMRDGRELRVRQYSKNNEIWATWIYDDLFYILPPSLINEIKSLPPEKLSFIEVVDDHFLWNFHLGDALEDRDFITAVKAHLNPQLRKIYSIHLKILCACFELTHVKTYIANMTAYLAEQIEAAFTERLAPPEDTRGWRTVMLWDAVLDISHRVVAVLMVGPSLGATEQYIHHAFNYIETVLGWSGIMFILPSLWMRKLYFRLSPGGQKIRRHLRKTQKLVTLELRRIMAEKQQQQSKQDNWPLCLLDALVEVAPFSGGGEEDDDKVLIRITNQMLFLTFAASGLYCVVLCQAIYFILGNPEYIDDLREEIKAAVQTAGGLNKQALAEMYKLDSFLRETLRSSPPTGLTLQRKLHEDIILSDGTTFKAGNLIAIPSLAILHDVDLYTEPHTFDPYRFYDRASGKTTVHSVTQTAQYPVFGYGTQTCPGRFFAMQATKLALAHLLMDYDMKFLPKRQGKPVDWPTGGQLMPNVNTFVAFRRKGQAFPN